MACQPPSSLRRLQATPPLRTSLIGTEYKWRHPLLDMPTTLKSRNAKLLNNIPNLLCSWHFQQGMAPHVLCPYISKSKHIAWKVIKQNLDWLLNPIGSFWKVLKLRIFFCSLIKQPSNSRENRKFDSFKNIAWNCKLKTS